MPYFLDSNVIIGYIFYNTDKWGKAATHVFEDPEPNHSGSTVKQECFGDDQISGKVNTIFKYISSTLRKVHYHLKKGKSFNQVIKGMDNERFGEIVCEIQKISKNYPNRFIGDIVIECSILFQNETLLKKQIVNDQCFWHYCNSSYKDVYNNLSKIIPDYDDIEVLIDAHHVSLSVQNLIFISGDYYHVLPFSSDILKITKISNIKELGDFE